jgi:hypothetical protein
VTAEAGVVARYVSTTAISLLQPCTVIHRQQLIVQLIYQIYVRFNMRKCTLDVSRSVLPFSLRKAAPNSVGQQLCYPSFEHQHYRCLAPTTASDERKALFSSSELKKKIHFRTRTKKDGWFALYDGMRREQDSNLRGRTHVISNDRNSSHTP